jgi:hypothetical protein
MLQAKWFDAQTETSSAPPTTLAENRFPYGWRYVTRRLPTGAEARVGWSERSELQH